MRPVMGLMIGQTVASDQLIEIFLILKIIIIASW